MNNSKKLMTCVEAGRLGAIATNKIYTTEMRRKAGKKAWKNRQKRIKEFSVLY